MKWPSNYSWNNILEIMYGDRWVRNFILIVLTTKGDLKEWD
jgi:hypothetical protein